MISSSGLIICWVFLTFGGSWSDTMNDKLITRIIWQVVSILTTSSADLSCRKGRVLENENENKHQVCVKGVTSLSQATPEGHSAQVILEVASECSVWSVLF